MMPVADHTACSIVDMQG